MNPSEFFAKLGFVFIISFCLARILRIKYPEWSGSRRFMHCAFAWLAIDAAIKTVIEIIK